MVGDPCEMPDTDTPMPPPYQLAPVLDFLQDLQQHNQREWFGANKARYDEALGQMVRFAGALLTEMNKLDVIQTVSGKSSLHRIYRDVRFSKDKRPYKNNFSGRFKRATALRRGGFYFHVQPGESFVGGGFWGPNAQDLKHLRDQLAADDSLLRTVLHSDSFVTVFGELSGEELKTAPRNFSIDHPAIDLIRKKQFLVKKSFTDEEALSVNFHIKMAEAFEAMLPFFDAMTEYLTTDLNGTLLEDLGSGDQ